ncbi:DUF2730 family protein [Rhodoplanes serenus]|uniref:DUF2730 family protein n=1 Tax=Rhodoplanes serenus TaxID=200615 RepID=A0A9X4XPT3_9BRAD|nr:DUF2730 family protein [Rhodoplanes serenus]MTW19107.1 DUF2730 family protein [Rhodoplanes serenus]
MTSEQYVVAFAGPAVALALGAWSIIQSRRKANADQLTAVVRRVDAGEDRLIRIEEVLEHMPDRETTHRLELSLTKMQGDLEVLAERMRPIAAISDRLQDVLIEEGRSRR